MIDVNLVDGQILAVRAALLIEGWMTPDELAWLAYSAHCHKSILEIGSWLGRSTMALAMATEGHVTCVDTWAGSHEKAHQEFLAGKHEGWLAEKFLENTQSLTNLTAIRDLSLQFANRNLVRPTYDMIFLDASHDRESVAAEIRAFTPLLMPGGLLCGHDYNWPSVAEAVNELIPNVQRGVGSIWWAPLDVA